MMVEMFLISQQKVGKSDKNLSCKNIMAVIQFSQNLMQQGWINQSPFEQLPYFTKNIIDRIPKKLSLYSYACYPRDKRRQLFNEIIEDNNAKFEECDKVVQSLPLVTLKMSAYVDGEDDIVVGDILTCKLRVDYRNLKEGEQSGYVHSKTYPYLRRDTWYLIITDDAYRGVAAVEKLDVSESFFEKEYKERITRPGPIKFVAILCNDCYKGLDQFQKHEITVLVSSSIR